MNKPAKNTQTSIEKKQYQGIDYKLSSDVMTEYHIEVGFETCSGLESEINKIIFNNQEGVINDLCSSSVYLLLFENNERDFSKLEAIAQDKPFLDPIIHSSAFNQDLCNFEFDYCIHATLKPGTSDASGNVALEQALASLGLEKSDNDQGFLARKYFFKTQTCSADIEKVAKFLFNPELYEITIIQGPEYQSGVSIQVPLVEITSQELIEEFNIAGYSDQKLDELNKQRKLAANLPEMLHFKKQYENPEFISKRAECNLSEKATDVELETWFGLRSEHCFHKEFNARIELEISEEELKKDSVYRQAVELGYFEYDHGRLILKDGIFKKFIKEPAVSIEQKLAKRGHNWIASMFSDNSGVVYYDENFMFCIKVETHNSPSNIEPVQGAKTGLNGNFRDIMGTMRGTFDILAGFFTYCTADPHYKDWLPPGVKSPYYLLKGITQGVREAGNEMQIPTLTGEIICDPRFMAKCLVYCGAVGWSPIKNNEIDYRQKEPQVNDRVLLAGQAVGIDGIHGATESSLSASENISLGHVQADYSFVQVKVKEFMLEASRRGLFTAVTDLGAMGLGSASHEMARSTGGLEIDLAKHPVKYQGIKPWQINCSETQDRMLLSVKAEDLEKVYELAKFYEVQVSDLGKLTDSGYIKLDYKDQTVALMDIEQLFSSEPQKVMQGKYSALKSDSANKTYETKDLLTSARKILAHPDIANREWFYRQKDFSVKGGTIQGPLFGHNLAISSDVALHKPLATENYDNAAILYSIASYPKLSDLDAYLAVQYSFLTTIGKALAFGATLPDLNTASWDTWAACGNYCQPNSDPEEVLDQNAANKNLNGLLREAIAIRELTESFNIPVISGKDSMKCSCAYSVNPDFDVTTLPDEIAKHVSVIENQGNKKIEIHDPPAYLFSVATKVADINYTQNQEFKAAGDLIFSVGKAGNLSGSAFAETEGLLLTDHNSISIEDFKSSAAVIKTLHSRELLASSAYIHKGGLFTALFKSAASAQLGVKLNQEMSSEDLFNELPGQYLISVQADKASEVEKALGSLPYQIIGEVTEDLSMTVNQQKICLAELQAYYNKTFDFSQKAETCAGGQHE